MAEHAKTKPETFSVPELRSRCWTKTLIEKFLGETDTTRRNPHYRRAAPMKLYHRERVEAVETTEDFRLELRATQFRQNAARKAVATKAMLTLKRAKELPVAMWRMPLERLLRQAVAHYAKLNGYPAECKPWGQQDAFRDRICVNYLRHNATEYHENLEEIAGKVGKQQAYLVLWQRIGKEIKAKYPALAAEFDRQYRERVERSELTSALNGRRGSPS